MTEPSPENRNRNRISLANRIDIACDAFEREWISGRSPNLQEHLDRLNPADRDAFFSELLKVELEHRRRRGKSFERAEYERRFPQFVLIIRDVWLETADGPGQPAERNGLPEGETASSLTSGEPTFVDANKDEWPAADDTKERSASADGFLQRLADSRLLEPESLKTASRLASGGSPDATIVAARLVENGLLTNWQAQALLAGRTTFFLGKYRLLDELGRGGMGVVFEAAHEKLGRQVALKVMSRRLVENPDAVARFRREIAAAAALNHPGIVHAYDADCVKNVHFLVMEYVEGETLSALSRRVGPLPVHLACDYVRQAALALQHAHERGLVHRDIKPSNMLLTRGVPRKGSDADATPDDDTRHEESAFAVRPRIKILDFGLARYTSELSADGGITTTGQMMGTPDYVAPEQAQDVKQADIRSDIYSLGCTLFRLLAGRSPFAGSNPMEVLMARVLTDAPRIGSLRADVPPELDDIVARMLQRDPDKRFQTPNEVAGALSAFCQADAASPIAVRMEGTPTRSSDIPRTGEVTHVALSRDPEFAQFVEALATSVTEEAPTEGHRDLGPAATSAGDAAAVPPERRSSSVLRDYKARSKRDRRRIVLVLVVFVVITGLWAGFGYWWSAGETRLVIDWPIEERDGATLEIDGRPQEFPKDRLLVLPDRPGQRTLRMTRKGYHPIEESLDLAYGEELTYRPEWKPTTDTARRLEWEELKSATERTIATAAAKGWDADRKEVVDDSKRLLAFRRKWPHTPESLQAETLRAELPSPFDALKFRGERPGIKLSKNLELVAVLGDPRFRYWWSYYPRASVNSDGKYIASSSRYVTLWDAETGRAVQHFDGWGGIAFHPDNKRFAYHGFTKSGPAIVYFDLKRRREIKQIPMGRTLGVVSLAFSPDGRQLLVCNKNMEDTKQQLMILDAETGRRLYQLVGHERFPVYAVWRPNGDMIASWDDGGNCRLWRLKDGEWTSSAIPDRQRSLAFSPDGKLLAGCMPGKGLRVWDVSASTLKELPRLRQTTMCCTWHPDGQSLVILKGGNVEQVRRSDGKVIRRIPIDRRDIERALHVDREGKKLLLVNAWSLRLWDLTSGKELLRNPGLIGGISTLNVMQGGREIRAQTAYGLFGIWTLAAGNPRFQKLGKTDRGDAVVSPDGSTRAIVLANGTIRLERPGEGPLVLSRKAQIVEQFYAGSTRAAAAFDSNGRTLAVAGEGNHVLLIETATGQLTKSLGPLKAPISAVCFSRDGHRVAAAATDGTIITWELKRGSEVRRATIAKEPFLIRVIGFVGSSNKLFIGGYAFDTSTTLGVIDFEQKKGIQRLTDQDVLAASLSNDGNLMVTAHAAGHGRIWRLPDLTMIAEFTIGYVSGRSHANLPRDDLYSIALAPDNRHILTGNTNGTVYVLRLRRTPKSP